MNINNIEKRFGFEFPDKFHRIYSTGAMDAMEWIECGSEEFQRRRSEFTNDPGPL